VTSKRVEQLQAQAARTRGRLLEVARTAFAESGEASLNSIAKTAGVGIGTVYRHFPSREDLVFAVYRDEVKQLSEAAGALLVENEPLVAFRAWLDRFAQYSMTKAGLVDALRSSSSHSRFYGEAYGPVVEAIGVLLDANEVAGTLEAGITPDDVLLAVAGLYQLDSGGDWQPRAARLLDFVVAGMRRQG
jgi:AcrR family transcriptional regulator